MEAAQQLQAAARRDAGGRKSIEMEGQEDSPAGMPRSVQRVERQSDGHRDDRGKLQRAVQDRSSNRPARQLCNLRYSDEQVDVRLHSESQPAKQSRAAE